MAAAEHDLALVAAKVPGMPCRHVRHHSRRLLVAAMVSLLALSMTTGAASGASRKSSYEVGSSCTTHGPYKHSTTCRYPADRQFTTTFLFKSKVGAQRVRVCTQFNGPGVGSHHHCVTLPGKISRKILTLSSGGLLHSKQHIKLMWYVKNHGNYQKVGTARQTLVPN